MWAYQRIALVLTLLRAPTGARAHRDSRYGFLTGKLVFPRSALDSTRPIPPWTGISGFMRICQEEPPPGFAPSFDVLEPFPASDRRPAVALRRYDSFLTHHLHENSASQTFSHRLNLLSGSRPVQRSRRRAGRDEGDTSSL